MSRYRVNPLSSYQAQGLLLLVDTCKYGRALSVSQISNALNVEEQMMAKALRRLESKSLIKPVDSGHTLYTVGREGRVAAKLLRKLQEIQTVAHKNNSQ